MSAGTSNQYIEIGLGVERYALHISEIHEIIKMQTVTTVPNASEALHGVINLRGLIVPIISLRERFGLPDLPVTKATRIVVVRQDEERVGIVVDRVSKVAVFGSIEPPPQRIGTVSGNYFSGIGVVDDGLVGILRLEALMAV